MRCECYEDVVAASSIIRPGVAESGMMREYVERFRAARGEKEKGYRVSGLGFRGAEDQNLREVGSGRLETRETNLQSEIENRKSKIENPRLAELLAETYGVMVYQEDVLKVVHELGGLSLGEADILRRAMSGKAGAQEAMGSLTERFFAGCRQRGVPESVIQELWRQIETFARFSFCKGHSAAFAVLSYQVAYLKAHWPAEFMAAVLSNGGGFYGAAAYIQECRRMGLRVLGPDVNGSEIDYTGRTEPRGKGREEYRVWRIGYGVSGGLDSQSAIQNPQSEIRNPQSLHSALIRLRRTQHSELPSIGWVRVGFAAIKNFPLDLAQRIVRVRTERPFDGLEDFLRRVRPSPEATEKLIRVGAMDCFGIPRERLFLESDIYFRERADDAHLLLKV